MKQQAEKKNCVCEVQNLITPESRQKKINFDEYDGVIFGFPVYNERLPTVIEEWFVEHDFNLSEKKENRSTIFFTFGGRDNEQGNQYAHYLLSKAGFSLWLAGEFVGPHTFNAGKGFKLAENHPTEEDFELAKEFVEKSIDIFEGNGEPFQMNKPIEEYVPFDHVAFVATFPKPFYNVFPQRVTDTCSMCKKCEEICPVEAFDATTGKSDQGKCIACMACVTVCPEEVIKVGDMTIPSIMMKLMYRYSARSTRKKKSRIFTEFPRP